MTPEEMAIVAVYAHSLVHPELREGCASCHLVLRAEGILEDIIDCDRFPCPGDHLPEMPLNTAIHLLHEEE